MTSLPASNLGIAHRGLLKPGNFADVTVFDPERIAVTLLGRLDGVKLKRDRLVC